MWGFIAICIYICSYELVLLGSVSRPVYVTRGIMCLYYLFGIVRYLLAIYFLLLRDTVNCVPHVSVMCTAVRLDHTNRRWKSKAQRTARERRPWFARWKHFRQRPEDIVVALLRRFAFLVLLWILNPRMVFSSQIKLSHYSHCRKTCSVPKTWN